MCLDNVYCGAFFQKSQDLIDWANSQKLLHPIYCIGDGHPGIWNLFQEIGEAEQRQEILDWYLTAFFAVMRYSNYNERTNFLNVEGSLN